MPYYKYNLTIPMGNCQQNTKMLNDIGTEVSQSHLIDHWNNLPSNDKRRTFQQQLNKAKLSQTIRIYKQSSFSSSRSTSLSSSTESDKTNFNNQFRPIPQQKIIRTSQLSPDRKQLDEIGFSAIRNGEVAVFIMSGNQSTQLSLDFPIGIYDIGLDSACSIFEIFIHKLTRLNKISGAPDNKKIKLYIMTSTQNKQQIKNFLKLKQYFGYGSTNVFFFSQPSEPVVDQFGKIALKNQSDIYTSPRGNGGIYYQMKDKNLINHLMSQNIKYVFIGPTNNILLKIADPCSLGILIKNKQQVVSTCFQSKENIFGYFGLQKNSNKVKVYEQKIVSNNKKWANSGSCFMTLQFLMTLVNNQQFMKKIKQQYHDVIKETIVFNPSTNVRSASRCVFFQNFYHEAFPYADKISILQIDPEQQFAPIKNNVTVGKYSINYARNAYWNWSQSLLAKTGIQFKGQGHIEIHPALTYQGQNIQEILKQRNLGKTIQLPQFLS